MAASRVCGVFDLSRGKQSKALFLYVQLCWMRSREANDRMEGVISDGLAGWTNRR